MSEDKRDLDESFIFDSFDDEESLKKTSDLLKRLFYGEPVNKNPLTEIPRPEMVLYHIHDHYFDTLADLNKYCSSKDISVDDFDIVSYLRTCAGRNNVIMKKYHDDKIIFYTAVDEDGYCTYNIEKSIYRGEFVWEYNYGHIRDMYEPFRNRRIIFENDIYAKIDEKEQKLYEYCKKHKYSIINNGGI